VLAAVDRGAGPRRDCRSLALIGKRKVEEGRLGSEEAMESTKA
jgi:hypothetical protein